MPLDQIITDVSTVYTTSLSDIVVRTEIPCGLQALWGPGLE